MAPYAKQQPAVRKSLGSSKRAVSPKKSALKRPSPGTIAKGFSRPLFERMLQVHEHLQAGNFPNCQKLSKAMEVSAKTIQRDIDFMRDRLQLPIEYDQLNFGFYYTKPVTHFPRFEVTEGEIIALFVAKVALAQYRGTSFEKPLQSAFQKITDGLQDRIEFQWADVDSGFSFKGLGNTVADLELFEILSQAVLQNHEVEFKYKKLNSSVYENRRIQPLHLGCFENQWYLFGYDLVRQQQRTFALPRIGKARRTGKKFKRPVDFSIQQLIGDSFGIFSNTGDYKIRIRFDAFASQLVEERKWHPSQKTKKLGEGKIELSLRLGSLEEIERWILGWGSRAEVLEPKELACRIKEHALKIASFYP